MRKIIYADEMLVFARDRWL